MPSRTLRATQPQTALGRIGERMGCIRVWGRAPPDDGRSDPKAERSPKDRSPGRSFFRSESTTAASL
jgi:hypothetical protein